MDRLSGGDDDIPLEFGMMTRQIENAQKRIEATTSTSGNTSSITTMS